MLTEPVQHTRWAMFADRVSGVYEIRNTVSGRVYVGSSVHVHFRWCMHRYHLKRGAHANRHLQRAWDKYGAAAFDFVMVVRCEPVERLKLEEAHIRTFERSAVYNMTSETSCSAGRTGQQNSPEHRARASASLRGKPSWNKGGSNTWAVKAASTRVAAYAEVLIAEHLDGSLMWFTHEADAARYFGYKRKRVNESLRRGSRLRTGWQFRWLPKEVFHSDL